MGRGQEHDAPWWPVLEAGPLLRATDAANHYTWLVEETDAPSPYSLILPIAREGWAHAGVELVSETADGVVINYDFGGQPHVLAPTLAVMLDAVAEMVAAGAGEPRDGQDARVWRALRARTIEDRPEWKLWPYDRMFDLSGENWPPHWRAALEG